MARLIENESAQVDSILSKLLGELRGKAIKKALRARGNVVIKDARERVPQGDVNHYPDKKPLKKTIGQVVRVRNGFFTLVVGADYPAGAHAHLVEDGHEIVTKSGERTGAKVEGKQFMAPAIDTTQAAQESAMIGSLEKDMAQASK